MSTEPLITARHLGITFGASSWVLRGTDFCVRAGEFLALVGPSGCGKTTLLRLLAGLEQPSEGELAFAAGLVPQRSFVFQESTLLPWRTALENVRLPQELAGQGRDPGRAAEALQRAGLSPRDADKFPRQLSGGMKMRVSLARALVNQPRLLLLDEPFAAVDDLTRQTLNDELLRLWRAEQWTAVLVTHNLAEAVYLSQRILAFVPRGESALQEIRIDGPRERKPDWRSDPRFHAAVDRVASRLREST